MRDVYDDMMLDGVQPTRDTFHSLITGTMKGARLEDAFFFTHQMKSMGLVPDVCELQFINSLLCFNILFCLVVIFELMLSWGFVKIGVLGLFNLF